MNRYTGTLIMMRERLKRFRYVSYHHHLSRCHLSGRQAVIPLRNWVVNLISSVSLMRNNNGKTNNHARHIATCLWNHHDSESEGQKWHLQQNYALSSRIVIDSSSTYLSQSYFSSSNTSILRGYHNTSNNMDKMGTRNNNVYPNQNDNSSHDPWEDSTSAPHSFLSNFGEGTGVPAAYRRFKKFHGNHQSKKNTNIPRHLQEHLQKKRCRGRARGGRRGSRSRSNSWGSGFGDKNHSYTSSHLESKTHSHHSRKNKLTSFSLTHSNSQHRPPTMDKIIMAQGRTSGRKLPKRNSNHHSKSDLSINFAKNPSIQWELRELESLENDVDILWKEYESLLGIQIDPMAFVTEAIESSTSDGKDGSWTSSSAKTTTIDKLIKTEAIYKDLAVKLRRLIARWSTLHHDIMLQNNNTPSHILSDISNDLEFNEEDDFQEDEEVGEIDIEKYDDDDDDDDKLNVKDNYTDIDTDTVTKSTSKNQPHSDSFSRGNQYHDKSNKTNIPFHSNLHTISPADKAESYIEMLELLRNSRHFVIHDCISRGKKEQNKGTHKGILEWAKNIFTDKNYNSHISSQAKTLTSSQTNDPSTDKNIIEDVENLLTAHLSNDFVANTKLYKEAMICRIHWYSGPKSISNFTSNLNLISGGKNDFDAFNNEDGTHSSITENTNGDLIKPNSMYNENREIQSTGSSQPPKNSVLAQHLMNMLNCMSYHWSMGNMYARPDRECYHIVLGVCRSSQAKKFVDTTKAEILLNQMEKEVKMVNSHSNGFSSKIQTNHALGVYPSHLYTKDHEPYTPNLQTYHLVLGTYENAIKLAKRNEKERQKYAFAAENILNCLVNKQRRRWNSEGNNDEEDLNFPPKPSLHTL